MVIKLFKTFEKLESNVRSYCRKYPVVFDRAVNSELYSVENERYIDFLAVAGSINYGHNNPKIKAAILDYLREDHIINALDMYTKVKEDFLTAFNNIILKPRGLDYKVMCCGSTGTNAVEAALKLARKNKKRANIFAFSGAFHGMTMGSLSCTTDKLSREGGGIPLSNVSFMPYCNSKINSIDFIREVLSDDHSGYDKPAAIILETVQAEGGINVAEIEWLRNLREICDENDIMMIVDDIQVGNGRTGTFFSFERAGIVPDMIVLSKSISGFGIPMSLLLMKPEYDIFKPAEHNGTFRGNQLGFVGCKAGLEYFSENKIADEVKRKGEIIKNFIEKEICTLDERITYRGIGMIWGIDFNGIDSKIAIECIHRAFDNNLIMEVAGRADSVVKIMPPLTIEDEVLIEGLSIVKNVVVDVLNSRK